MAMSRKPFFSGMPSMTPEEFEQYIHAMADNAARWREQHGPDWVEAYINLIDAMRDFIKADTTIGKELFQEGAITRAQYENGIAELDQLKTLLRSYEAHGLDPSLHGAIKDA